MNTGSRCAFLSATLLTLTTTLALTGCGAFHPEDYPLDGAAPTATANPQKVTAEQFGHSWPLTVDRSHVGCDLNAAGDPVLSFTAPDGTAYALNALEESRDNEDIVELATGSIGPLRTSAFAVCDVATR